MRLAEHLDVLEAGPTGPEVAAFFDLDGTLVSGFTANAFLTDRVRHRELGLAAAASTVAAAVDGTLLGGSPTRAGELAFKSLSGLEEDSLVELGERLFVQEIARTIRPEARALVRAHRRLGHTVVISSAATRFQVAPVARDLGIDHLVCTEAEVVDGVLTGKVRGAMRWGPGKGAGVREFARANGIDLRRSYGYGNGNEDIDFLATVGSPVALSPDSGLRRAAQRSRWPVLDLADPASGDLGSSVRTLIALGGMNAGAMAGIAIGLATGSRRRGTNAGISLGTGFALKAAGVQLDVRGADLLDAHRPAVVVANHQSALDPVVLAAVLGHDFTAVAKKEARFDPRALLGSALLDPVYIDRGDSASARASMAAVGDRIREGTSIMVFPEGTRSPTPVLGRFRKGAFHLAIETGAPVLPVVLHNTGEILPRNAYAIRPGTIRVTVLPAISDWTLDNLGERVEDLHARFADVLAADLPEGEPR